MFSRTMSRARLILVAVAAAALVLAGSFAWQAQAHDRLIGSDPEDGSTVESPIESLTLSFNNEPQNVEPRAVINGSTTGEVELESITVDGQDVTVAFSEPLANDSYAVAWRVVSSDGHPIEGELTFTVDAPVTEPTDEPTGQATDAPTTPPAETATTPTDPATDNTQVPATPSNDDSKNNDLPIWLISIVGIGVIGAVSALLIAKTRRHNA